MQLFNFAGRPNPHQSPYSSTPKDTASPICSSYIKTINAQEESKGYRYRSGYGIMTAKRKDKETAPFTNKAGEVRELKVDDFAKFQPADEVIPDIAEGMKRLRGQRGKQKAPTKVQKTLRLSPEVVAYFQSQGKGWQTNVDKVLKEYVKSHK